VKGVDDRLSENDELFDADGYYELIKGYADISRGPGYEQDDGRWPDNHSEQAFPQLGDGYTATD
jgi:hypothetical protein